MTRLLPRNDPPTPLEPGPVTPAKESHEELWRRARALGHDAGFLVLVRRPDLGPDDVLRLALGDVPALAEEFGGVLGRTQTPGPAPMTRVWLA